MTGKATFAACEWIKKTYPGGANYILSGNMDTDKKHSRANMLLTRGKRVVAECTIKGDLLKSLMGISSKELFWSRQVSNAGAFLAGSANNGAHAANGLTAMFIATGQDVANVSESHAGVTYAQLLDNGDYYWSITLTSLIVATYGGGTGLATQRECLEMMAATARARPTSSPRSAPRSSSPATRRCRARSSPATGCRATTSSAATGPDGGDSMSLGASCSTSKGKVALVTGGSRGLGLQMAEVLGELGAKVAITARKQHELDAATQHLKSLGIEALPVVCDMGDLQAIAPLVDTVIAKLGPIDILVNNAGTSWGAPTIEHPLDGWNKVMTLNVTALFVVTQEVGPPLHGAATKRQGHQHRVDPGPHRHLSGGHADARLQREQGRGRQPDAHARRRVGAARHQRQRDRTRLLPDQDDGADRGGSRQGRDRRDGADEKGRRRPRT